MRKLIRKWWALHLLRRSYHCTKHLTPLTRYIDGDTECDACENEKRYKSQQRKIKDVTEALTILNGDTNGKS